MEGKEDIRKQTEAELIHLRKEILLLGELQLKYDEALKRAPKEVAKKQEALYVEAYEQEIASMQKKVDAKCAETDAMAGKISELEQTVLRKDLALADQKRMIKRIKVKKN